MPAYRPIHILMQSAVMRWASLLLPLMLMVSCRSHKAVVVNADSPSAIISSPTAPAHPELPELTGEANNATTLALLNEAYSWIGTPYLYGGQDKNGADCSGFVMEVYLNALNIQLPRVSKEQGEYCRKIKKDDLFPGDLVFFRTGKSSRINHVGLYIGDGKMIHASSKGVMVSDLSQKYYVEHYDHSGYIEDYRKMIKK